MSKTNARERTVIGQTFLQGAIILTIGMALTKVVGAFFKIPLANVISENGMGYFNTAYTLYNVIFSLSTAGFPIAITKLVAQNYSLGRYNDVRQIKRVAIPLFSITGFLGMVAMFFGAGLYTQVIDNPGAMLPVMVLAPSILFCCLCSIYRGYYGGLRNMYPIAVSEVLEALAKLVFGLSLSILTVYFLNSEYEAFGTIFGFAMEQDAAILSTYSYAAAAAILGVTLGSMISWVYLIIYHRRRGDRITPEMYRASPKPHGGKSIAKKLILIAIPIGIGSLTLSIAGMIDTTFLLRRIGDVMAESPEVVLTMYNGYIPSENLSDLSTVPNFLFGCYTNALTIYMLVPTVTQALGISALPSLTDAWTKQNKDEIRKNVEAIIRITCLICIPAGLGIVALAQPIAALLYGSGDGSHIIGQALSILGFGAVFSALGTPISSMLQAVGRVDLPVKFLTGAMVVKIVVNYILCGIPEINIIGAAIGTIACYSLSSIGQIVMLLKVTKVNISFKSTFLKPLISAVMCALSAFGSATLVQYLGFSLSIACIVGVFAAILVYIIALLFTKTITKYDISMLPKSEKILILLEKRGWIG